MWMQLLLSMAINKPLLIGFRKLHKSALLAFLILPPHTNGGALKSVNYCLLYMSKFSSSYILHLGQTSQEICCKIICNQNYDNY